MSSHPLFAVQEVKTLVTLMHGSTAERGPARAEEGPEGARSPSHNVRRRPVPLSVL